MEKSLKSRYPVVSIITPSLNQGQFIEETIKSVLSQEGDFCLEYIIMDGGSTDDSLEIIKKYGNLLKDKTFPVKSRGIEYRWISEPDKGQADAINKGFRLSRGEIIAYLNSDDLYNREAISKAINCFLQHPEIGLAYGDSLGIELSGEVRHYKIGDERFCFNTMKRKNVVFQPAVFVRREVLGKAGYLNTAFDFVIDYEWFVRISKHFKGNYVPSALSTFRRHPDTKTHDRHAFNYRGEYLTVILKYAGGDIFSKAFGNNVIQIANKKNLKPEETFNALRGAVVKAAERSGADSSPGLEKAFSKGYAYVSVWLACISVFTDRGRAKDCLYSALSKFPGLLSNQYSLRTLMRLYVPRNIYSFAKKIVRWKS